MRVTLLTVFQLLTTLFLGVMAWDVHRGTRQILARAKAIRAQTDALLRRESPSPPA